MTHRQLYKEYLRILRVWPKQPNRQFRFDLYLVRLKDDFKLYSLEEKQKQVEALKILVADELEKKYISQDSIMKSYLPAKETYSLLDKQGQKELDVKRSPFKMLLSIMSGQEKLRNE